MPQDFNSRHWFPLFEKTAAKYYERADRRIVSFRAASIPEIEAAYPVRVQAIKDVVFDTPAGNRIDRHKVLALYVQLYLEKPLFWLNTHGAKPNPSPNAMMINEIFCLDVMRMVLTKWTGKRLDAATFEEYKYPLLKLLEYYRNHSEYHKRNLFFTFNFAHLIYFIEREFFR
jgi:hypothetical protein